LPGVLSRQRDGRLSQNPGVTSAWTVQTGLGRASGNSEGFSDISAHWEGEQWVNGNPDEWLCYLENLAVAAVGNVAAVCNYPIQFHEDYAASNPDGSLYFRYHWNSSSFNLPDLAGCTLGEEVSYNPWPGRSRPSLRGNQANILNSLKCRMERRDGLTHKRWRSSSVVPVRTAFGGELDKLASNISIARNFAGVHIATIF
jgi:hypothetical protein